MNLTVDTPKGKYTYKLQIVYEGVKRIDKVIAKENLLLFREIATRNNLFFGLAYGTLLGAIREHDFISHDEDIDLYIFKKDLELFKSMLWELRENGFELIRYDRREGLLSIMRKGEYIDFYIFSKLCEGFYETLGSPMPAPYLEDVKLYEFQGQQFYAAHHAEECMAFLYGSTWKTPIQRDDFEMSFWKKTAIKLEWWVYFMMPDFIFKPLMEKRGDRKIRLYNRRALRLAEIMGREVFPQLPFGIYHVR